MYRLILIVSLLIASTDLQSQAEKNFSYYNNETYNLYQEQNWEKLIDMGKESIQEGHDFYYLRMRIGISYYSRGKFVPAIRHFKKALNFDDSSYDAKEYLYFCHFYMGRLMEAKKYFNHANLKNQFFKSIYLEPGLKISDGSSATGNIKYIFAGLNHELGANINFFHGYQRLAADFVTQVQIQGIGGGSSWYDYAYTMIQNEYYAAATILLTKGLFLMPAFHVQGMSTTGYSDKNRVYSAQLAYWLGRIKAYGGYSISEINSENQQQLTGGLTYYPFGNLKLFLNSEIIQHQQNNKNELITKSEIGIKTFPKTWLSSSWSIGDMANYNEANGYLVYNQLDTMKSKWSVAISQYIGSNMLYFNYTHENKEEYETGNPFVHHVAIVGLNINF